MLPIGYYLGICMAVFLLQCLSILGNGFILLLFFRLAHLRKSTTMKLIFYLSLTDWLFAVGALTQIVYFIANWNSIELNYDPLYTVTTYIPLTIQLKVNLIISLSIALDRFQATRLPAYYRKKNHTRNATITLSVAIMWGLIDVFLEYFLTIKQIGWKRNPGCVAGGCFVSDDFRAYWGTSNVVLGAIGIAFTAIFAYEIKKMRYNMSNRDDKQLIPANRLSFGILLISAFFIMLPSAVVGVLEKFGFQFFKQLGPYYTLCLIIAGVMNSVIEMTFHVEIRKAIRTFFGKNTQMVNPIATISPPTIVASVNQQFWGHRVMR